MQDAFGGILNIILIAVFLIIIEGILGLVVNYSKAFRMKNIVISNIERYEGYGCFSDKANGNTDCRNKIMDGAKSIGYAPTALLHCDSGNLYVNSDSLFCYKELVSSSGNNRIYTIVTQVDINIPIINRIMGLSFFQVHGATRVIKR